MEAKLSDLATSSISPSPASTSSSVGQLFYVQLLTNSRISRCQGCRGAIEHGLHSPHNIVIQHKEHVLFQNPHTGNWQLSRDLRNTYYHPFLNCILQFIRAESVARCQRSIGFKSFAASFERIWTPNLTFTIIIRTLTTACLFSSPCIVCNCSKYLIDNCLLCVVTLL